MASKSSRPLKAIGQVRDLIDAAVQAAGPVERALHVARALREVWPCAALFACHLEDGAAAATGALDAAGKARARWASVLGPRLRPGTAEPPDPAGAKPPAGLRLAGHLLHTTAVIAGGCCYGSLAVAAPATLAAADLAAGRTLLAACADRLALHLRLEELQGRLDAARADLAEQTAGADVAEAFSVFLHELGNLLNNLTLETRLLEREAPEGCRPRVREIGRLAGCVPDLVGRLLQYRQQRRAPAQPIDLNRAAAQVADGLRSGRAVCLEPAAGLPPVRATTSGLRRVVRLLLDNALAVTPAAAGPVRLRTEAVAGRVRLTVEDRGPAVPAEVLPLLFEPFAPARPGQNALELAVCQALVRRLQGTLHAANLPGGGVAFVAEFPSCADESRLAL